MPPTKNNLMRACVFDAFDKCKEIICEPLLDSLNNFVTTTKGGAIDKPCSDCTLADVTPCGSTDFCKLEKGKCLMHTSSTNYRPCPNGICDKLQSAIKNNHSKQPKWKNSNIKRWGENNWEIAKCFLQDGKRNKNSTSIYEIDFTGIILFMFNAKFIYRLRDTKYNREFLKKCIKARNGLNSKQLAYDDCITYIEMIKKLIFMVCPCPFNEFQQGKYRQIEELKDDFSVENTTVYVSSYSQLNTFWMYRTDSIKEHGYALVINIYKFNDQPTIPKDLSFHKLEPRQGTQMTDVRELKKTFKKLNYKLQVCEFHKNST